MSRSGRRPSPIRARRWSRCGPAPSRPRRWASSPGSSPASSRGCCREHARPRPQCRADRHRRRRVLADGLGLRAPAQARGGRRGPLRDRHEAAVGRPLPAGGPVLALCRALRGLRRGPGPAHALGVQPAAARLGPDGLHDGVHGARGLHAGVFLAQGGPGVQLGFVTTTLDAVLGWGRKYSIFQYPFVTACCGMEYMSAMSSHYDLDRFGAGFPRFSPRQADLLMVVGTISHKMAPVLRRIYDQMASPRWVVAFGVCTCTGGFYDNYSTVQGIDTIVPVDLYIPGCPPRPEIVIQGLMKLQEKIQKETRGPWHMTKDGWGRFVGRTEA
ncbi:MAG: NADH-quinone oxidoreductase subunit NuoB [Elusimicrobia bacterium]|nr:NADH-quinone oxidoreductase subunit NuoB [Elusimicrobiota bacterium]